MRVYLALCLWLLGCGSDDEGARTPSCTGSSCVCPTGASCDLGGSTCSEGSCSLDCANSNTCTGSCAESCSIDCSGGSTCTVTVGPSGSVSCDTSSCHVTCTGSCSLSCTGAAECHLTCPGDSEPHSVPDGGRCE